MAQEKPEFSLKVFPHGETKQTVPLTVNAPVIIDAGTEEGLKPLLDFVQALKRHDNKAVAEKESERLAPYFSSMSVYLTRAIDTLMPESLEAHEFGASAKKYRKDMKELATPGNLSGVFNAMAACTRNTLISDVAIMPYNVIMSTDLFNDRRFKVGYSHGGYDFDFGFLQVSARSMVNPANKWSTAFATFMIDNAMMEAIRPHQPEALLRDLQAVMTFVNHDMLHHFTSPVVNGVVATKFGDAPSSEWMDNWSRNHEVSGYGYEEWAQIGQEKILLIPENAAQIDDVCKKLDHYFDELGRIGKTILSASAPGPGNQQKAHATIEFFGMVMAHALTRVFPLNHPVMAHCLDCLQKTDPDPERTLREGIKDISDIHDKEEHGLKSLKSMAAYRYLASKGKDIVASYKNAGLDILPDEDAAFGYKNLKLLQLIRLGAEDIHPHTPGASSNMISKVQKAADEAMLNMLSAAAKTSGYKPG